MSESKDNTDTIAPVTTEQVSPPPITAAKAAVRPRGTSYVPKAPAVPRPPQTAGPDEDDESFFERNRLAIIIGAVLLAGVGWYLFGKPAGKSEPPRKPRENTMVFVMPPPPPPPPTPPPVQKIPPPPKDEKKVEMAPTEKPVEKAPVEKPAEKPPEGLGTSIKGGEGMAGLSLGGGNGLIGGEGSGAGGGGGSMGKWYAGQMGNKIAEALRNNRKTRSASMRVEAQVWVDPSGRISRATLDRSTGDPALDEALKNEVLPGIQLSEPPPQGMRMPIPYRFTARRPN